MCEGGGGVGVCTRACVGVCMFQHGRIYLPRSGDNLRELVLFFHHVGSED